MKTKSQLNSGHNSITAVQPLNDSEIQGAPFVSVVGTRKMDDIPNTRKRLAKTSRLLFGFIDETRGRELNYAIRRAFHEGRDFSLLDFARELNIHQISIFPTPGDYQNVEEDFYYGDHFAFAEAELMSHVGGGIFRNEEIIEGVGQGGDIELSSKKL